MGLDYELIDFGSGRKLERFGSVIVDRPEVLAEGIPKVPPKKWKELAHGFFDVRSGKWKGNPKLPHIQTCGFSHGSIRCRFQLHLGKFKHVGLFPEQENHWKFLIEKVKKGDRILNLFGYTGAASICAAKAGGDVFHVDSSKSIVKRAAENAKENEIETIHWVVEDALSFAKKEERRGRKYDFLIMDPPVYGRGKKGEHWKLEDKLPELMRTAKNILEHEGILVLNTYSPKVNLEMMEELATVNRLSVLKKGWLSVESGERKLKLSRYLLCGCA